MQSRSLSSAAWTSRAKEGTMAAAKKKTEETKMIKVTLVKSTIACLKNQKANVEALGLHLSLIHISEPTRP